jgi:hypothetical protein
MKPQGRVKMQFLNNTGKDKARKCAYWSKLSRIPESSGVSGGEAFTNHMKLSEEVTEVFGLGPSDCTVETCVQCFPNMDNFSVSCGVQNSRWLECHRLFLCVSSRGGNADILRIIGSEMQRVSASGWDRLHKPPPPPPNREMSD